MLAEHELWMNTIDQIDLILPKCARTIGAFYHKDLGFSSKPTAKTSSIISHSTCVETSLKSPFNEDAQYSAAEPRDSQLSVFLDNVWDTGAPKAEQMAYSISFAVPAFTKLYKRDLRKEKEEKNKKTKSERNENSQKRNVARTRIKSAIVILDDSISKLNEREEIDSSSVVDEEPLRHGMILYRLRRALDYLETDWAGDMLASLGMGKSATAKIKKKLRKSIGKLDSYMKRNLYYFLSMCSAIPDNDEDALQLGYLAYALSKYSRFGNDAIIEHAFSAVLGILVDEHHISRLQVVYRSGDLNIAASPIELLRLLSETRQVRSKFDQYWKTYDAAYNWLVTTKKDGRFRTGPDVPSWMAEPWRGAKDPEAWLNVVVIEFFLGYKNLLRVVCSNQFLASFKASSKRPKIGWDRIPKLGKYKTVLKRELIVPIKKLGRSGIRLRKASIILFGPPGTAKTTIARALASEIGWPLIELLPHDFAEEGTEGVIRLAKRVFRKLLVMRECVVFFDEIDELVRERKKEGEKIGRFITTSVLPWFQELRSAGEVVFVVATNHISLFDPAIKRQGRFDYVIPVGPPGKADQKKLLEIFYKEQLEENGIREADTLDALVKTTRAVIGEAKVVCRVPKGIDAEEEGRDVKKMPDTYTWPITVLELLGLTEHVARELRSCTPSEMREKCREVVDKYQKRVSKHSVISGYEWFGFREDMRKYRTE